MALPGKETLGDVGKMSKPLEPRMNSEPTCLCVYVRLLVTSLELAVHHCGEPMPSATSRHAKSTGGTGSINTTGQPNLLHWEGSPGP